MRTIRPSTWLAAAVPAILACSAPARPEPAVEAYARDVAVAVRLGGRCAEDLAAIAGPSPASVSRALDVYMSPRASNDEVRARVRAEIERRQLALSQPGAVRSREPSRAAAAAAGAHRMADALCQARDVGFSLARVSRSAHPPRSEAFTADRRDPGSAPP